MPRTKQIRNKSSMIRKKNSTLARSQSDSVSSLENDEVVALLSKECTSMEEFIEEFEKFYNKKIEDHNRDCENACEEIKKMMKHLRDGLPQDLRYRLIHDETDQKSQDVEVKPSSARASRPRSRTPDESLFKRPKSPSAVKSRTSSRKRSVSTSSASSSRIKTPLLSRRLMPNTVITPKVYSNTPISMMRRPLTGEVAVSMSGSPLMVGAIASDYIPTVNVPLQDGRVFSIMPEPGAPPPDFPDIDPETLQHLKTLRAHLEILAPSTP